MNRHLYLLNLATRQAKKFNHTLRYHLCAILARRNKIISFGFNKLKTHPLSKAPFHCIHAELDAIIGIDADDLAGSTLYVVRVGSHNRSKLMMAKPCIYCQSAIENAGIKDVFYSISDESKRLFGYWNVKTGEESLLTENANDFVVTKIKEAV